MTMEVIKKLWILVIIFFIKCGETPTEQNFEDIQKIQYGMSVKEVERIMRNKPIRVSDNPQMNVFIFDYKNNAFGASDNFRIYFSDRDSTVISINYGE